MTVTNTLVTGQTVETTEVTDAQGRSHWVARFLDETGAQMGWTVSHPYGSEPKQCTLHKRATYGDAVECVESFGTERHP